MPDTIEAIYRIFTTRSLTAGEQRLPVPADKLVQLDKLTIGQQVEGKVLEIAGGKATLQIGNQMVRMELPVRASVGDTFRLIFAGQNPRPTFLLSESGRFPANPALPEDAAIGRVLNINNKGEAVVLVGDQTVHMELPAKTQIGDTFRLVFAQPQQTNPSADGSADFVSTHFSDAAQLLGAAMKMSHQRHAPASVTGQSPIIDGVPLDTVALAVSLRQALARTGLFYESHLNEWTNGRYPLSSLLREPQGQHSSPSLLQEIISPIGTGSNTQASQTDLLQLISQQLQLLENNSLTWRGDIWPGQNMEWQVSRQDDKRPNGIESEAGAWSTRLTLEMPQLGKIIVDLRLDTHGKLDVRMMADENAAPLIEPARQSAMQRLETAGCQVNTLSVTSHGNA